MANKNKRNFKKGTRRLSTRGKVIIVVFLLWTVLGGLFISKVLEPTIDLYILQDNHVYTQQYGNPDNWEARDEAYNEYKDKVNDLINNSGALSGYFKMNGALKALSILVAAVPYFLIAYVIVEAISEATEKRQKSTRLKGVRA